MWQMEIPVFSTKVKLKILCCFCYESPKSQYNSVTLGRITCTYKKLWNKVWDGVEGLIRQAVYEPVILKPAADDALSSVCGLFSGILSGNVPTSHIWHQLAVKEHTQSVNIKISEIIIFLKYWRFEYRIWLS